MNMGCAFLWHGLSQTKDNGTRKKASEAPTFCSSPSWMRWVWASRVHSTVDNSSWCHTSPISINCVSNPPGSRKPFPQVARGMPSLPQLLLVRWVAVAHACSLPPLSQFSTVSSQWPTITTPALTFHAFRQNSPGPGFYFNSSCLHRSTILLSINIPFFENTGSPESNLGTLGRT